MRVPVLLAALALVACKPGTEPSDTTDTDTHDTTDTDIAVIDVDHDGSPAGTDCDDNDPIRFPGNPEVCDGVDNDCDGSEAAVLATWWPNDGGAWVDLTGTLGAGDALTPIPYTFSTPGALALCGGRWYTNLEVAANTDITGLDEPTIDGAGLTAVAIDGGVSCSIDNVRITASNLPMSAERQAIGAAIDVGDAGDLVITGGSIENSAYGVRGGLGVTVTLTDLGLYTNATGVALPLEGATVALSGVEVLGSTASGVDATGADIAVTDSLFKDNHSFGDGGAIHAVGGQLAIDSTEFVIGGAHRGGAIYALNGSLVLDSSQVNGNYATTGGALFVDHGTAAITGTNFADNGIDTTCRACAPDATGGAIATIGGPADTVIAITSGSFLRNATSVAGGAILIDCFTDLTVTGVTFGDGVDENTPDDVSAPLGVVDLDGSITQAWTAMCD